MSWTEPSDVLDRWVGPDPEIGEDKIATLIKDAERMIVRDYPRTHDRMEDETNTLTLDDVQRVVARVVIRHMRNPEGYRQSLEALGPESASVTYAGDDPGALYLTARDRQDLTGGPRRSGKAYSIDPLAGHTFTQGHWAAPDVWVPVEP